MKNMFRVIIIFICIVGASLGSCSFTQTKNYMGKASATNVKFYRFINGGQVDSILSLFREESYENTCKDSTRALFAEVIKFGTVLNSELKEATLLHESIAGIKKVKFVEIFKVEYSGGFISKETITYLIAGKDSDFDRIYAYHIDKFDAID